MMNSRWILNEYNVGSEVPARAGVQRPFIGLCMSKWVLSAFLSGIAVPIAMVTRALPE